MSKQKTERPRQDNRSLLAGMHYVLRTGCPWKALPRCFGAAKTVYHRFRKFIRLGLFQVVWRILLQCYDQAKALSLKHQSVDSNHRKSPLGGEGPVDRRKLGSKIIVCVEENGIPFRRLFVRYDKTKSTYLAFLQFAFQCMVLKKM